MSDITEYFDKLWIAYPNDLCRKKKGGKAAALKALEKLKPDETEMKRIFDNLKAQVRYWRQDPDADRWPFLSTYLNQSRFDDDIPSVAELKERQALKKCACGQEVHGPRFDECQDCLLRRTDQWEKQRISALRDIGLLDSESTYQQVIQNCKQRGSVNGKFSLKTALSNSQTLSQKGA